jgi:methylated-DNA-[protein]-cysteine S-methyltransferase
MRLVWTWMDSPVGELLLAELDGEPAAVWFRKGLARETLVTRLERLYPEASGGRGRCPTVERLLRRYFEGRPVTLKPFPRHLPGTPFERSVWRQIARIPFGRVRTYGEIARSLGRPGAARAVGQATGRNPVAILIPCHRVVGHGGRLTGFGGGLGVKRWLLEHEGLLLPLRPREGNARDRRG